MTAEELVDDAAQWNHAAWVMFVMFVLCQTLWVFSEGNGFFWVSLVPAVCWVCFRVRCGVLLERAVEVSREERTNGGGQ